MSLVQRAKELVLNHVPERYLGVIRRVYYAVSLRHTELRELMDGPILERLISPGDHVADIGASVGYYTKVFSERVGPKGHVFCVEPMPVNVDSIRFSLLLWGQTNVELVAAAVSDCVSTTTMTVPGYGEGGSKVYEGKLSCECTEEEQGECVEICTTSLDELFGHGYRRIDLIKLDAMCHELTCLAGAVETIERQRPAWLIAVYTDPNLEGSDATALFKLMTETHGYGVYWHDTETDHLRPWKPGENTYRFFFLDEEHLSKLRDRGVTIDG